MAVHGLPPDWNLNILKQLLCQSKIKQNQKLSIENIFKFVKSEPKILTSLYCQPLFQAEKYPLAASFILVILWFRARAEGFAENNLCRRKGGARFHI
jgi:hypothetical protein